MPRPVSLLILLPALHIAPTLSLLRPKNADLALNLWPMIQAHDAGTVYLRPSNLIDDIVYRFTRTQNADSVSELLDCGVRAFDWRPSLQDGVLGFAHGPVFINHSMELAAAEVVSWANNHSAEQEDALVVLVVADCNSDACVTAANAAFAAVGMPAVGGSAGCAAASDYTLSTAMAASALAGGGHAIAIVNCPLAPETSYDEERSCLGFLPASERSSSLSAALAACMRSDDVRACAEHVSGCNGPCPAIPDTYACYTDGSGRNASYAFNRLRDWLNQTAAVAPPSAAGQRGLFVELQGCWAQNDASTVLSFLYNSSLLDDDARAEFNRGFLMDAIQADANPRTMENIGLLGINAACDGGPEILAELRKRVA